MSSSTARSRLRGRQSGYGGRATRAAVAREAADGTAQQRRRPGERPRGALDELATEDAEAFRPRSARSRLEGATCPCAWRGPPRCRSRSHRTAADVCEAAPLVAERCDGVLVRTLRPRPLLPPAARSRLRSWSAPISSSHRRSAGRRGVPRGDGARASRPCAHSTQAPESVLIAPWARTRSSSIGASQASRRPGTSSSSASRATSTRSRRRASGCASRCGGRLPGGLPRASTTGSTRSATRTRCGPGSRS